MPFGTITAQTITFEPRRPGTYTRTGLALGAPTDEFRLSAAAPNAKAKRSSVSITRIKHKDFVPPGTSLPVREESIATVNIQMPNSGSFSAAEIDSLVTDISEFLTSTVLTRLASGEI